MLKIFSLTTLLILVSFLSFSQGVTTGAINGTVTDPETNPLPGATVVAVHEPSGTQYGAVTRETGMYNLPGMRIGGPYKVTISFAGFEPKVYEGIYLQLGQTFNLDVNMDDDVFDFDEVEIRGRKSHLMSDQRTGASTNISPETIQALPTINRSVEDFTRLTPQSSRGSFAGQDIKSINFSLDGTQFNNAFGSSGIVPGAPTNSTPISLDAIEELQVDIAPYDVTQGGFVGASINAVTRSGDNEVKGSVFYNTRNDNWVGTNARGTEVVTENFNVDQIGFRVGGPIIKNKLFFFLSGESERRSDPNSPFLANAPGRTGNNVTRVEQSDLEQLRGFLIEEYGYDPGLYEGYNLETKSDKILVKLDYNINESHHLSFRYNILNSSMQRPTARTSFGFGGRNLNLFSLNFQNSNYDLVGDIYSGIVELNSSFSNKFNNRLIFGYTKKIDSRTWAGGDFPAVDILEDGRNYITFGTDVLSPNRALQTDIYQIQNNFTAYFGSHTITAGFNFEFYEFDYTFTPAYFGQYTYNSLADFYADAAGEEVELRRFLQNYSGLPGGEVPNAITQAYIGSIYLQDQFKPLPNVTLTGGVRLDVPFYGNTARRNPAVESLAFRQPDGSPINIRTDRMPRPQYMVNPRFGFNWDVKNDKSLQVRGGSGFFAGRPIYINVSNMINSNGITIGQVREDNTTNFPFSPEIDAHVPENPETADSYDLAYIERNFRNPQVWRSNLAIDKDLFGGVVATLEAVYTRTLSDPLFYESNLNPSTRNLSGPDNRPLYGFTDDANRINQEVTNAVVMGTTNRGYSYSLTAQLQKSFSSGIYAMLAYNYGVSKNMADGNTQHFLSYENIHSVRGGNYPSLGFSLDDTRHRIIGSFSYRKEYSKNMASQISLFYEASNQGVVSYVYNGDANGDLIAGNDLMYVPTSQEVDNMLFEEFTVDGTTYTASHQRRIFEAFIDQDDYLRRRRGDYAERHGVQLPITGRLDLSFMQEFFINVGKKRNTIQLRADIINFSNMINSNWGAGYTIVNDAPVGIALIDPVTSVPTYRLNTTSNVVRTDSFRRTGNIGDVWQLQFGIRYIFN